MDAGGCAAQAIAEKLKEKNQLSDRDESGKSHFFVSDEIQNFAEIASRFLGRKIENVTRIDITGQKPEEVLKFEVSE